MIQTDSPVVLIVPSFGFAIVKENHRCLAADVKAWGCCSELLCSLEEWGFSLQHTAPACGWELSPWSPVSPLPGPYPSPRTEKLLIYIRLEMVLDRWTSSRADQPLKCLQGQVVLGLKHHHRSSLVISLIPSSFWEDGARGTERMLAYKGIVLHCRDAAGPALWLGAGAKMKGWQSCILRNYSGELATCCLENCDHLHVIRIISSLKCQWLVLSHGSKPNKFCLWQIICKSSIEHRTEHGPDTLHALMAARCQGSGKSTPLLDVDHMLRPSMGDRLHRCKPDTELDVWQPCSVLRWVPVTFPFPQHMLSTFQLRCHNS